MVAELEEKEKRESAQEVKSMAFLQMILLLSLNCCFLLCVLKPVLEKCDQNINKKWHNCGKTNLHLRKTTPRLSDLLFCLVSSTSGKVQRFGFDKQRTYSLSERDLVCLEEFSQYIFSSKTTG